MSPPAIPERIAWAIETMDVRPDDRLLEIGPGQGVAIAAIGERLTSGTITGVDRSAKAIDGARRRNERGIAAGKVVLRRSSIEDARVPDASLTKVFAINVNLFWVRHPGPELALIRSLLEPGGTVYLFYEPPDSGQIPGLAHTLSSRVREAGLIVWQRTAERRGRALLCVAGRLERPRVSHAERYGAAG